MAPITEIDKENWVDLEKANKITHPFVWNVMNTETGDSVHFKILKLVYILNKYFIINLS